MSPQNERVKVFDSDFHIMEPLNLFDKYLDKKYRSHIVRFSPVAYESVMLFFRIDDEVMPHFKDLPPTVGPDQFEMVMSMHPRVVTLKNKTTAKYKYFYEKQWSGSAFIEAMDQEGVDVTVLYPTSALLAMGSDKTEPGLAAAIARAYNDYMYDLCETDRRRMYGAAMISVHDIDNALAETKRAVTELGFKSVFLRPNLVKNRLWYDAYYEPLWALAQELNVPICFHEGLGASQPHIGDIYGTNLFLHHVACHPMEMMMALMQFCGGGILEKYPRLRVAFLEANVGWAPWLLHRMDDHYELEFGVTAAQLPHKPSFYFKRQCYLSAECDEELVSVVARELGDTNIVFSTDFPHPDAKYPRATRTFLDNKELSDVSKRRILWDNTVTLYGMQDQLGLVATDNVVKTALRA